MNSAQRLSRRTFVFHGLAATAGMTLLAACGQPAPSAPAAQPTSGSAAANAPTQPAAAAANAPGAAPKPTTPPTPGPQQLAPAQAGGVSLVVWKFGGSNEELSYFPKWNAEFTKRTGIGLDYSNNDWSTKREKILAAFQAKSLPDVLLMDGQSIPDLAKLGVIQAYEDLDKSLMAKWQPSFIPEIWNSTVNDGKFYGPSPYVDMGTFLAYNKQMFQDAGISRAPETWDDVRDAAKKLTTSDRAGIALGWTTQTNDANTVEGIAYANGGRWLDDTGKKVMINDAGFVDTLQMFVDIVKDGSVPQGITETNFGDAGTLFFQGKAAMWPSLSYVKAIQVGRAPDDFPVGMTVFPHRASGPSGFAKPAATIITPTAAVLITTQSQQKQAALQYADFWSQPEVQAGWDGTEIHGRVPALKANWETETFKKLNPDWYQLYKSGKMFDGSVPMPSFAGLSEAEKALSTAMQQAVLGQASSQDALTAGAKKAQAVIDDLSG